MSKTLRKFRVVQGVHVTGSGPNRKQYYADSPDGDIVETSDDLLKLNSTPNGIRFVEVTGQETSGPSTGPALPNFNAMTIPQLREYAVNNEIELGDAVRKDEIIAILAAE